MALLVAVVAARYRPGDAVRVSYDPAAPERAVLAHGEGAGPALRLAAGLVVLLAGAHFAALVGSALLAAGAAGAA